MDTTTEQDQYDKWMDDLERQVRLKREMRDAQQEGDEHYRRIQGEATQLTARLYRLEEVAPRLRELDGHITGLESRARGMQYRLDEQQQTANRFAGFAGVTAVVVLLVCMGFSVAWWVWLLGLLFGAGAVVAGLVTTRQQLNPPQELQDMEAEGARLRNERKQLMPQ